MTVESIKQLEKGDKILFKGRKTPLTVTELKEGKVMIKGPQGGLYQVFEAENTGKLLISKPGKRDYASYVEELRKVGEWKREGKKSWQHTKTGAKLKLVKNQVGFWTIEAEKFEPDLDLPKYGFSNRENAEEEIKKVLSSNPEG